MDLDEKIEAAITLFACGRYHRIKSVKRSLFRKHCGKRFHKIVVEYSGKMCVEHFNTDRRKVIWVCDCEECDCIAYYSICYDDFKFTLFSLRERLEKVTT